MADLIERYKITANLPSVLMNYCNRFNSKQLESITEMIYELENSIESADVQPVDRWISVKNKFPNDGERVIACTVDKMVLEMKFDKRRECWGRLDIDGMHLFGKSFVTRWMPLPEPPKDGDTNG